MEPERPVVPGYVLLERLGAGGTGQVWRARRSADRLVVALKIVQAREGDLSIALREAAVLSRVHHPHLLHLYDVLPLPGEDGRPAALALAVQLASGGSLAQVLAARRHLSVGELVTVVAPVAAALADLHRVGVVHGDVSPGNVLFLGDGMPMLSDVGVSRLVGEPVGVLHGTDGMVAPEVIEGFPPGPEADVYAVGALAWMCLTGQPPGWVGIRSDLEDLVPDLDQAVRDLVHRCLAPEPEDRPEAEEVSVAVFGLGRPEPVEVAPQADPGLSLTRRLRAAAQLEEGDEAPQLPGVRAGAPRHRWARAAAGPGAAGQRRERSVGTPRRRALLALMAVVGAALLAGFLAWGGTLLWGHGPAGAQGRSEQTVLPVPRAIEPTPDLVAPTPDLVAPTPEPVPDIVSGGEDVAPSSEQEPEPLGSLVQELVDARARAWEVGDPAMLDDALATDSPAWQADQADLQAAQLEGVTYDGVAFTVVEAVAEAGVGAGDTTAGEALLVDVVVESAPVQILTSAGARSWPGDRSRIEVELRRMGDGWRLWSWDAGDG